MAKKQPDRKRPRRPPDAAAPAKVNPGDPAAAGAASPEQLSPEEQMERFAQDLKENDWGHQPC